MKTRDLAVICCLLWLGTAQCDSREPTGAAESYPLVNVAGIIEPYSSENTFNASSLSLFEGASRSMEVCYACLDPKCFYSTAAKADSPLPSPIIYFNVSVMGSCQQLKERFAMSSYLYLRLDRSWE